MQTPSGFSSPSEAWDLEIDSQKTWRRNHFKDAINYRDLLMLLVKRDLITIYKQTILGPLWLLIQPILKVAVFYFVFGKLAGISTDGVPAILFYLTGLTFWEFFAAIVKKTSDVFIANQNIFSKVYFPRMIMALAAVASSGIKLSIQFSLFFAVWIFYLWQGSVSPNFLLFAFPIYLIIITALGLAVGLILSSLTAKFRDLRFVIDTGLQVMFYLTPVIYPLSLAEGNFLNILFLNPITPVLEALKFSFLGHGIFDLKYLIYSMVFSLVLLLIGVRLFERTERTFIDTI